MRVLIVLAALILHNGQAAASDGNALQVGCNAAIKYWEQPDSLSAADYISSTMCVSLVRGARDTIVGYEMATKAKLVCIRPGAVSNSQAVRVVAKYLNDHPEKLHLPDTPLIIEALKAAFPCSGSGAG